MFFVNRLGKLKYLLKTKRRQGVPMCSILHIAKSTEAWNIDGSSDDRPPYGWSWIQILEEKTGRKRGKCSFMGCPNRADTGGHVWIRGSGCCIAPICRSCNRYDNETRMQGGGSRLRNNTLVMKSEMTCGMRNAHRNIASESRETFTGAANSIRALGESKNMDPASIERIVRSLDLGHYRNK